MRNNNGLALRMQFTVGNLNIIFSTDELRTSARVLFLKTHETYDP